MTIEQSSNERSESLNQFREECIKVIDRGELSEREAKVLKLRFGLEDGRTRTREEVAAEFGSTRERILQIEAKALRKIRHPSNRCAKENTDPDIEVQNPDERLIQCVIENGVALGNPKQFSLCSVGFTNEIDMTLMTRGDHLLMTLKIMPEGDGAQVALDFIHFNSKDACELVMLSSSQYTMVSVIDKKKCNKNDLHITLLKIYGVDAEVVSLLTPAATEACSSITEIALSLLNQLIRTKCKGLSLKDFGYCSYE